MLLINVFIFGDLSLDGSNQIVLILSGGLASIIAYFNGVKWKTLQEGIVSNINSAIPSLIILLLKVLAKKIQLIKDLFETTRPWSKISICYFS